MSAHDLFILLDEFGKSDISFSQRVNKFNNTKARMLNSVQKFCCNGFSKFLL